MRVINKSTGACYACLLWNGKNTIEIQQFGVTGTKDGRQTKINCQKKAFVKVNRIFIPIPPGTYIVIEDGVNYVPYTEDQFNNKYKEVNE